MAPPDKSQYGKLSLAQKLGLAFNLIPLPVVLLWKVVTTSYAGYNQDRTLKRIMGDAFLWYTGGLGVPQLQCILGTDQHIYQTWTKANKLPSTVDELGDDARLFWIGPKRTERVVLFLHGGGFLLPTSEHSISFWRYTQLELEKKGVEIGVAVLEYTLAPYATFPTPLNQARLALNFLFEAGVKPSDLQIVGDSAGGNLTLQILSHILHPLPSVPLISLPAPIQSAMLVSPWISLSASSPSHKSNDGHDFVSLSTMSAWGPQILRDVPAEHRAFAEAVSAPENWFVGAEKVFQHVLISAGGAELLKDDIESFAEAFKKQHNQTEFVVQPNGRHQDMFLDFFVGEKKVGMLTPLTIEWLAARFSE
ncbi:Abhydrolase-3 domain-containing protein [Mycena indigotica]|uniref:Abhydrolase-3 domain-containing protein n=1 Tax=Mycena indigotica TaxID=2126181 RepID=A0A8H6SF74_9AGAR|nr:Abhydrolase-3 domain-containing protein [Mycena indigotica]KAF7297252.1 Abhydrolase-3 domain-containing protein [Mycena indigotica]